MALVRQEERFVVRLYPEEASEVDTVGETGFLERVYTEFGMRAMRGTALGYHAADSKRYNIEPLFRSMAKGTGRAVEIGTFRGISTAVLAHYYDHVDTIDLLRSEEAFMVWRCFGVDGKITPWIADDDEVKKAIVEELEPFDFAFIDALHTYEGVELDFELCKSCGNVLFHDYGMPKCAGVTEFVNTLPKTELTIDHPFALWRANGHHHD